jgi:hypothetical protein
MRLIYFKLQFLQATKVEVKKVDFNPEFTARMIPKIDWPALCQAAKEVFKLNVKVWLENVHTVNLVN